MTQRDGMGGRWEGGSGWGTRVYAWWIHVDVWQTNTILQSKKKKRKKKILITLLLSFYYTTFHFLPSVIEMQLTYTFFFYIIILKNCLTQMSTGALLNCLGLSNFQRSHPGKIPSLPQDFWGFLENLTKILTSAGVLLLTERQTSCCIPSTPQ